MKIILLSLALFVLLAQPASAATSLEVSGWVPWWQDTLGLKSATKNIKKLDTVNPFVYSVNSDGTLKDEAGLDESQWKTFVRLADSRGVDILPSIAWSDGEAINKIISDESLRSNHIAAIVNMVEKGKYDGVDIDYESKLAETKDDFSLFLKELKAELGTHKLSCTVEARTPAASRYKEVPENIEYANDYQAIGQYCDTVEIMAYDQQRIDLLLNSSKNGEPYIPVADVDWVEKVVKLALEDIPAEKIMLGVPTYGRQWKVTIEPDWYKEYKNVGAINLPDAKSLAKDYKTKIATNQAGEKSFSFFPNNSVYKVLNGLPTPDHTRTGFEAAAKALLFADLTGHSVDVNVVWYSDADAIKSKVDLAKKYQLKGIAIFKIDGEEDNKIWSLF